MKQTQRVLLVKERENIDQLFGLARSAVLPSEFYKDEQKDKEKRIQQLLNETREIRLNQMEEFEREIVEEERMRRLNDDKGRYQTALLKAREDKIEIDEELRESNNKIKELEIGYRYLQQKNDEDKKRINLLEEELIYERESRFTDQRAAEIQIHLQKDAENKASLMTQEVLKELDQYIRSESEKVAENKRLNKKNADLKVRLAQIETEIVDLNLLLTQQNENTKQLNRENKKIVKERETDQTIIKELQEDLEYQILLYQNLQKKFNP